MTNIEKTYSIGAVAKMTGITKGKLRHWTDKHLTHVQRIQIGESQHRRYTEMDIQLIQKIKEYREYGYTLDAAVAVARKKVKEG